MSKFQRAFLFLSPAKVIKDNHLSKKDVSSIKDNINFIMGAISLIIAIALFVISLVLLLSMLSSTDGKIISTYGLPSFVGQISALSVSVIAIILELVSLSIDNKRRAQIFSHTGYILIYLVSLVFSLCSIVSDAMMGFTTQGVAMSAGILILLILVLIQSAYWIETIILDLLTVTSLVVTSVICSEVYGMTALQYYILFAAAFLIVSYIVCTAIFFAESQRYCQKMINARLYDTAIYDELTRCKNRYALRQFLKDNADRWNSHDVKLLIIMFDIDNFKEYNDQFSHPGGDYCLKSVTDAVRREFPSPGLDFFRYGGEEFLLFFETRGLKEAKNLITRVRDSVRKANIEAPDGAPKEYVSISVGGLLVETYGVFNFDNHLKTVDSYLYKAKRSGKDKCCLNDELL